MTRLAYRLEDTFSAAAHAHRGGVLGRLFKALACGFALLGDTLRTLDGGMAR